MSAKKKVIIWGTGQNYSLCLSLLRGMSEEVEILAVVSSNRITGYIDDLPVITGKEVPGLDVDGIVVTKTLGYPGIHKAIVSMGVDSGKIVPQEVLGIRGSITVTKLST